MANNVRGFTDEAAVQDLFEIQEYIDGLTEFIETCNTPMTISIQGSWGTGKTSIMQIINNTLNAREKQSTHSIWFNTWQFSQFDMDDDLTVSLLSCLLTELAESDEQKEKARMTTQALRFAGRVGKELLLTAVDSVVGGKAADKVENFTNKFFAQQSDPASTVKELRKQFAECVKAKLDKTGKDRVVIFIDDLDRLTPRRAVELLEVLKLFLDCKNCVFVLAIDYAVVCRGVEAKYGDLSDDKAESAEKGRSFFDKIIQVPFKMPVAKYNIENYVKNCFQQININCSESEIGTYKKLIEYSIGVNPRSMKRLFNAYLLLTIVVSDEILKEDRNEKLLFALLCLQHSYENIYNFIVGKRAELSYQLLEALSTSDTQEDLEDKLDGKSLNIDEVQRARDFLGLMIKIIDISGDGEISDEEIENLRNVLEFSTMTSSSEDESPKSTSYEVDTVKELGLNDEMVKMTEALLAEIRGFGEDITILLQNSAHKHITVKNGTGKTFMSIYFRKRGFGIDCYTRSMRVKDQEVRDVIKKYSDRMKVYTVGITVKDEETRKDALILAKACYENCQ